MFENIKSIYFLKLIFQNFKQKRILELVKYNKNIQNKLDININSYKAFAGRYFIGDKNGKGKEYDLNHNLIFEGEYSNGKRNGYGKEYYKTGKLIFSGEYLNGKRWKGKVTEYIENNRIIFIGYYKNGEKWQIKSVCNVF